MKILEVVDGVVLVIRLVTAGGAACFAIVIYLVIREMRVSRERRKLEYLPKTWKPGGDGR